MLVELRVAPGFASVDARPFAFILGPRPVGNIWIERDLTRDQIEILHSAKGADGRALFQFAREPAPLQIVTLGGRDITGRRRVVVRSEVRP